MRVPDASEPQPIRHHKSIRDRISELFEDDTSDHAALVALIASMRENQDHAAKLLARYYFGLLILWAVFYAVGVGFVGEGVVASMKFADPKLLLIAGPPILGGLFYMAATYAGMATYLLHGIERSCKYTLPKCYALDLEQLVAFPTVLNVERFLESQFANVKLLRRVNRLWLQACAALVLVGSFVAIMNISHFLIAANIYTTASVAISVGIGLILWTRGLLVWYLFENMV